MSWSRTLRPSSRPAAWIPGLDVPVTVDTIHDPAVPTHPHRVTNPDPFAPDDDALVSRLWEAAFAAVPTPTVPVVTIPVLPGTRRAALHRTGR